MMPLEDQERPPQQPSESDAAGAALDGDDFTDEMTQGEAEADERSGSTSGSGGEAVSGG